MTLTNPKAVIAPVDPALIKAELTQDKFLRTTNQDGNVLYSITHHDSPHTMREIGRLREESFREAGGGTGKDCDIDDFDTADAPFQQLVVWDPDSEQILGGYRYLNLGDIVKQRNGHPISAAARLFNFSETFWADYVPHTLELGRSFIRPGYQATTSGRKALYVLDNLWNGLGALTVKHPNIKYFFGKVTIFPQFNRELRDMILYVMNKHFPDQQQLMSPRNTCAQTLSQVDLESRFQGDTYKADHAVLAQEARQRECIIPPLLNAYMNLSPTMKSFGTALNSFFGDVEETAILVTIDDIYEKKKRRHINSYLDQLNQS